MEKQIFKINGSQCGCEWFWCICFFVIEKIFPCQKNDPQGSHCGRKEDVAKMPRRKRTIRPSQNLFYVQKTISQKINNFL